MCLFYAISLASRVSVRNLLSFEKFLSPVDKTNFFKGFSLSLVMRSLIMIRLDVNFFGFILFRAHLSL